MFNDGWHDCPRCGKSNSCWGEHFCGQCEQAFHESEAEYERDRQAEADKLMRRVFIKGGEVAESIPTKDGELPSQYHIKLRRANGVVEVREMLDCAPAEVPGGGLWVELR